MLAHTPFCQNIKSNEYRQNCELNELKNFENGRRLIGKRVI